MTGRHRKQTQWTLRIGGAAVAGVALTSTFALAAQAASAATPVENTAPQAVSTQAPEAGQNSKFLALAQTPVTKLGVPGAPKAAGSKKSEPKKSEAAAHKPNPAQAAQTDATERLAFAQRLASAQDVIALAEKQVGIRENGSGETKFSQWYSSTSRALQTIDRDGGSRKGYLDASWCDMFVSWVASQSGGKTASTVGQDAWTIAHAKWFKAQGRWGSTPKPGAVVFFDWDGGKDLDGIDHVGYVVSKGSGGKINTVEGNTSNAVMKRVRSSGQIVGYGYPEYAR